MKLEAIRASATARPRLTIALWWGVAIYCCLSESLAADIRESKGTLTLRRYGHAGEIANVNEGSFELSVTGERFRVRMLDPTPLVERAIFVSFDGRSLYQSERIIPSNESERKKAVYKVTHAKLEARTLPTGFFSCGPLQGLALAYFLTCKPETVVEGNSIKASFVPEVVTTAARNMAMQYARNEITRGPDGVPTSVKFWAARAPDSNSAGSDRFVVAELRLDAVHGGLPSKLYFVINGLHTTNQGGAPLVDATFDGTVMESNDPAIFDQISFDRSTSVLVTDTRFPEMGELNYRLVTTSKIPFATTGANNEATQALKRAYAKIEAARRSRYYVMVCSSLIISLIIGYAVYRGTRKPLPALSSQSP